jgi:NAD+ synthase (glutamine-hydrolysing)
LSGTLMCAERSPEADLWDALVLGVRDYIGKNGFPGVLLGLSGGIDSALVLAMAVDALGAGQGARGDDAFALHGRHQLDRRARHGARLGVRYDEISIVPEFEAFKASAGGRVCRAWPRTPPKRTSRPASAARC